MATLSFAWAAALAVVAAAAESAPSSFTLTGACDVQGHIDGQTFSLEGHTASGAPFYKALNSERYLFYDPDCMGSGDGTPRWIIDVNRPSLTKDHDLDNDGVCDYIARVDSNDKSRPPTAAHWMMNCGGHFTRQYLILLPGSSTPGTATKPPVTPGTPGATPKPTPAPTPGTTPGTKPQDNHTSGTHDTNEPGHGTGPGTTTPHETGGGHDTTTPHGTGGGHDTTTPHGGDGGDTVHTPVKPSVPPVAVKWSGTCYSHTFMENMTFEQVGNTADGRPFYKGGEDYLYFDRDCDGPGPEPAVGRWILDKDAPSTEALEDLDNDRKCNYYARIDSMAMALPAKAAWRMYCGMDRGWQEVVVTLAETSRQDPSGPAPVNGAIRTGIAVGLAILLATVHGL